MGDGSGWKSDGRFAARRFVSSIATPRKYAAKGADAGATAAARKAFDEGARRQQYKHPVRTMREPTARG
jgi:hypothetical protein